MSEPTRVVVIGAGPGGYAAAFHAADLGLRVRLVDEAPRPGGVCLHRGCMPSKALLHVARVLGEARSASAWGVAFGEPRIDLARLRAWKNGVVDTLTGGLAQLSRQRAVDYVPGPRRSGRRAHGPGRETGRRDGHDAVRLRRPGHRVPVRRGRPRWRPPAGACWTRRRRSNCGACPVRSWSSGAAISGLELGTVYAALGSAVTVVEMTSGLLPGVDRDLVTVLARRLRECTAAIHLGTKVSELSPVEDGVEVVLDGPDVDTPRQGSTPSWWRSGACRIRVSTASSARRSSSTSRASCRSTPSAGRPSRRCSPSATWPASRCSRTRRFTKGRVAVEAIAGRAAAFEPAAIPAVVFTDPEVAWCGLTETQAARDGRPVEVSRFPWAASGRAATLDRPGGLTKLVIDPATEQIVGVGIVGAGAGELIAEGVLAVEMGATAGDLQLTIHPHPTLSETLSEAAEVALGQSTHVYRPSGVPHEGPLRGTGDDAPVRIELSDADRVRMPTRASQRKTQARREATYRWTLERDLESRFSTVARSILVCGLNPSTADAEREDPTSRRVIDFAIREGGTHLTMVNVYAARATDRDELPTSVTRSDRRTTRRFSARQERRI